MSAVDRPTLQDVATQQMYPLAGDGPFIIGRGDQAFVQVPHLNCSRRHYEISRQGTDWIVRPLVPENPTYLDDRLLSGPTPLTSGVVLRAGDSRLRFLLPAAPPPPPPPTNRPAARAMPSPRPAEVPSVEAMPADDGLSTLQATADQIRAAGLGLTRSFQLAGEMLIGREVIAQIPLQHPMVSRRHALVTVRDDGYVVLQDLGSANGTFVNGVRLTTRPVLLTPGDHIDLGPFALEFDGVALSSRNRANNIELVCRDVRRVVTNLQTGKPLTLLDGISLVFRPGEFVCLLGPSGSGKSTLMTILSGRGTPDEGAVLVNGQDLHASFDALKKDIALVPQKDVLHDSLTVGQALSYTAKLRLPPDTSSNERREVIDDILKTVQLTERRGTLIRQLSGGQIKRASLANEILCKPSLVFLDEVTSGLDEQTDRDMMELFREVAQSGKTVVCITHSLANVERNCDLIVVLTAGGKLAFVGSPAEALGYFNIERLGDVYNQMKLHSADYWKERFEESPFYQRYVLERLPRGHRGGRTRERQPGPGLIETAIQTVRQTLLLTFRSLAIWRGEKTALLAMMGQSIVVALLLIIVFGDIGKLNDPQEKAQRTVNVLFLLAVSSFWFGCNNSAKEIVKERTIFTRERDYNLLAGAYYVSKLMVLVTFSLLQTILLYALVKLVCGPPGAVVGQLVVLLALAFTGTTLGLLISTFSRSEEMAVTLIPMAIIPQIILSGAIAPLSGLGKWLARFLVTTYWGKYGLDALLPDKELTDVGQVAQLLKWAEDGYFALALAILGIHGLIYMTATMVLLMLQSRKAAMMYQKLRKAVTQ